MWFDAFYAGQLQVPELLLGVAAKPQQQRDMLLRLAFAGLAPLGGSAAPRAGSPEDEAAFAAKYAFLSSGADRAAFLDSALKLLLYAPAMAPPPPRPPAAGAAAALNPLQPPPPAAPAAGALAAATAQPAKLPPPGLALADLPRIEGKAPPKGVLYCCRPARARRPSTLPQGRNPAHLAHVLGLKNVCQAAVA